MKTSSLVLTVLTTAIAAAPASAAVINFVDNQEIFVDGVGTGITYNGTQDAELREESPNSNFDLGTGSSNPEFTVDGSDPSGLDAQVVMRFDDIFGDGPGQISLGSTIISATLFIDIDNNGNDLDLFRLTRGFNTETDVTWASFGNGVEADDAVDTGIDVPGDGNKVFLDVTTDVALWASGATNFGWAFLPTGNNGVDWDASENSDPEDRPELVVEFEAPVAVHGSMTGALVLSAGLVLMARRRV